MGIFRPALLEMRPFRGFELKCVLSCLAGESQVTTNPECFKDFPYNQTTNRQLEEDSFLDYSSTSDNHEDNDNNSDEDGLEDGLEIPGTPEYM